MSATFRPGGGSWTDYRGLPNLTEVDFHWSGRMSGSYWENMQEVYETALDAIRSAQDGGISYVMLRHGSSTSGPGKTTSRSVIRGLMRSPEATPFIVRSRCIQHPTVFVAAIRPKGDV